MIRKVLYVLLSIFAVVAVGTASAAGDSYQSLYTGWVTDGDIINANGCFVTFAIVNGSNYANVRLSGPSVPPEFTDSRDVWAGSTSYYPSLLRVYVDRVEGNRAYVDIAKPGEAATTAPSGTSVSCDVPGQTALGGDAVSFPIVIQNNDPSDHTYTLSSFSDISWRTWFIYGDKGVFKVSVPARQSKTVNLLVQTWANTPVGDHTVVAYVDNTRLEVSVDITSANQSADVSFEVSSKIASVGDKISYNLAIKNTQSKENDYKLSVVGLPDNWYARFKESASSTEEIAETVIPASSSKSLVLEVVPPYTVNPGDYSFTAIVTTPDGVAINKSLTLTLKSGTEMRVLTSQLAYNTKPGETVNIKVYVSNSGQGAALTNVYLDTEAPQGWVVQVSPNRTNRLKAGDTQAFTMTVQSPGNIVSSDYEVKVTVKSDQAEDEEDYRITVQAQSYVSYLAVGIIVLVAAGLFVVYRRYGRR